MLFVIMATFIVSRGRRSVTMRRMRVAGIDDEAGSIGFVGAASTGSARTCGYSALTGLKVILVPHGLGTMARYVLPLVNSLHGYGMEHSFSHTVAG
jgi:hypothetical protein